MEITNIREQPDTKNDASSTSGYISASEEITEERPRDRPVHPTSINIEPDHISPGYKAGSEKEDKKKKEEAKASRARRKKKVKRSKKEQAYGFHPKRAENISSDSSNSSRGRGMNKSGSWKRSWSRQRSSSRKRNGSRRRKRSTSSSASDPANHIPGYIYRRFYCTYTYRPYESI